MHKRNNFLCKILCEYLKLFPCSSHECCWKKSILQNKCNTGMLCITYVFYIQWKPEITWTPDPVNWRHMNPVCQTKAYSLGQREETVQNSSFSREGHTAMTHCTTRALEELCLEKGTWFFNSSYRKLSQGKSSSLKWRVWGTWLMGKTLSSVDILHWFYTTDSITHCQNQHLVCFTQECSKNCPLKVTEKSR